MPDTAEATAAPVDFEIGGRSLQLSPLTDLDHGELDNWTRKAYMAAARASLPDDAEQYERDEQLAVALREVATLGWFTPFGRRLAATPDGLARLIWQSVKAKHHDVTAQWIKANMTEEALDSFWESFGLANRGSLTVSKKGSAPTG